MYTVSGVVWEYCVADGQIITDAEHGQLYSSFVLLAQAMDAYVRVLPFCLANVGIPVSHHYKKVPWWCFV